MKRICSNCVHWKAFSDAQPIGSVWCGECPVIAKGDEKPDKGNHIRVYSDSIPVTTEENFGCVLFEPKKK